MDMSSRNQYLLELRPEYLTARSKKERSLLLDEAAKRTRLNRKYLMEKLRPGSNLDKLVSERKKRRPYYDNLVKPALIRMWEIFDHPCGQRLETLLRDETDRLRRQKELACSDVAAAKLKQMGSATIDRKLKHQKEIELVKKKHGKKIQPLLYRQIPIKVFSEQNRRGLGNMQIDLVEHCGSSAAGEFVNTLDITDIASGWTEQEAVTGKGQEPVKEAIGKCRQRCPFPWLEIHSDGGTEFINAHLFKYSAENNLRFSRSRPYKKNDNCLVEQKNNTHVRRFVGYLRYDTLKERDLLNDLYRNDFRLYKNFFQPVIKLVLKERAAGRIRRQYDKPRTPYQRLMESDMSTVKKQELQSMYQSLNPAQLKRTIDEKLDRLYRAYKNKSITPKVDINKKISVRFSCVRENLVSVR